MVVSLSARHIVKRYGGVLALSNGNLDVESGKVVALLGANGSGKSTLTKIITGVVAPNEGQLLLDGQPVRFSHPSAAKRLGIAAVYQELSLIPDLTIAENIWLTHEPMRASVWLNGRELGHRTQALLQLFSGTSRPLEPDVPVRTLVSSERQIVEILKAISSRPRLLILDEATASLDSQQVNRLFELIKTWTQQDMAIVFVSHRMDEIFRIADTATVIRNGQTVYSEKIENTVERDLIRQMIGETPLRETARATTALTARVRLRAEHLSAESVHDVSFDLHDGELLGLSGLQGQGQRALLQGLFGAIPHSGNILIENSIVNFRHPADAMKRGIAFVPGDRSTEGLMLSRSILDNFQLPSWEKYGFPLRMAKARDEATRAGRDLKIVMASLDMPVSSLSGGNAQKVVIGKWLVRAPKILLLNDPTKGVDVGAKSEFYILLSQLRQSGTAILFYSSDDEELLNLCDRVLVLQDGKVKAELVGAGLNRANLLSASMGTINGE